MPIIFKRRQTFTAIYQDFENKLAMGIKDLADDMMQRTAENITQGTFPGIRGTGLTFRGMLLQNLRVEEKAFLHREVISDMRYSAALNFGAQWTDKRPPIEPLAEWLRLRHHLEPEAARSAAWAVSEHLFRHGLRPRPFFTLAAYATAAPENVREKLAPYGFI